MDQLVAEFQAAEALEQVNCIILLNLNQFIVLKKKLINNFLVEFQSRWEKQFFVSPILETNICNILKTY